MSGIIYKGKNYSAMSTSEVATKVNQENIELTLESLQEQIISLQEEVTRLSTEVGDRKVLKLKRTGSVEANDTVSFTSNSGGELHIGNCDNTSATFVVDGISAGSELVASERVYYNTNVAHGIRIPFKNSITVSPGASYRMYYSLYEYV